MATENLHFAPLYIQNNHLSTSVAEPMVWVVMRSRKEKVTADLPENSEAPRSTGRRQTRHYGYELIQRKVPAFFMPMKERVTTRGGRRTRTVTPAIPDIFFVNDTLTHIDTLVRQGNGVEYLYIKGHPYRQPVIIRDSEMANFIAATTANQRVTFHTADSDNLSHLIGRRVRITHDGTTVEGELLTVRGSRTRRLRVSLPASSIVAYIDLTLPPTSLVEIVE